MAIRAGRLRIRRLKSPNEEAARGFEISEGGKQVGYVTLKNDLGPTIGFIGVNSWQRRRGLGTKLYEAAAKEACRWLQMPLHSDVERTAAAQAFWEKQERKGRASCEKPVPASMGKLAKTIPASDSVMGRGGCWRYKLTCPPPATLERARGRRAR